MTTSTFRAKDRLAYFASSDRIVAGNTYAVTLDLDGEWTGSLYMRVRFGSFYYDIPFASSASSVSVQMPVGYAAVGIGIFSEALEICTSEARVDLERSILEAGENVVEFDSDLYDQWENEVTELLTDSEFDAESTKPVQNATITAWKATVALDSAVVHKAGAEDVTGAKTFTADLTVHENVPLINIRTSRGDQSRNERYGALRYLILPEGTTSPTEQAYLDVYSYQDNARVVERMRVYNHGRSVHADLGVVAKDLDASTNPGVAYVSGTSYYPESGVPSENVVVTEGMLAADPQVVHTTGNEEVAGEKTFTGTVRFNGLVYADRLRQGYASTTLSTTNSQWHRIYEFAGSGQLERYRMELDDLRSLGRPTVTLDVLYRPNSNQLEGRLSSGEAPIRLARRTSDGAVEVWLQIVRQGGTNPSWVGQASLMYGDALQGYTGVSGGTGPAVGDVYDKVVDAEVVS